MRLTTLKTVSLTWLSVLLIHFSKAQDLQTIKEQKPVTLTGTVDVRTIVYGVNGIPARRKPFSFFLNGSPTLNIYSVTIPFSFSVSDAGKSFRQPFNQFGLSPYYKWATAHLGYRNLVFSPYTLAGHTMLGAGFELNPKKFRLGFMYGRLNRATEIDTTTGIVQPYSFSRKGYAAKIGYGTEQKLIEFSLLSAKDDSNSLKKSVPDSLKKIAPAANAVGSVRIKYAFTNQFSFEADAGASLFTFNSKTDSSASEELNKLANILKPFAPVNASSTINFAYTASLAYREKNYSLKLSYRRIDPEFQSMGAYYFQNDVQQVTFAPAFNAAKGKFRFNGSIGFQKDNLREQKSATTKRVIGSANISWDVTQQFGLDANYINFSANATPQVTSINNKYLLAQTNQNISITPRYVLVKEKNTHAIVASYNYSVLTDNNATTKALNDIKTNVNFISYNLTFNKIALTLTTGGNYTTTKFSGNEVKLYGVNLGASKSLDGNKLLLSTSNSYSKSNQFGSSTIINSGWTAGYNVSPKHRFSLRYNLILNQPENNTISTPKFTEHTGEIGYTLSF